MVPGNRNVPGKVERGGGGRGEGGREGGREGGMEGGREGGEGRGEGRERGREGGREGGEGNSKVGEGRRKEAGESKGGRDCFYISSHLQLSNPHSHRSLT